MAKKKNNKNDNSDNGSTKRANKPADRNVGKADRLDSQASLTLNPSPYRTRGERISHAAKVLVALVIIIAFACSVRTPDRQVTRNQEGYTLWVSESGVPYFLDPDSYFHVRISSELAETGHFGTASDEDITSTDIDGNEVVDVPAGTYWDYYRNAPDGSDTGYIPAIIYVAVALYKIASLFGNANLEWIDFYLVWFFMAVTAPIAWFFTRRAYISISGQTEGADVAGAAGALLVTCAPAFVSRTLAGNYETDMPQALFVVLLMLFMTELMRAKTVKKGILCAAGFGITTLLYVRFWSNSAIAIAGVAAIGGAIYVISLLFAKSNQAASAEENLSKENARVSAKNRSLSTDSASESGRSASPSSGVLKLWISRVPVKIYLSLGVLAAIFAATPWGRPYLIAIFEKIRSYMPGYYSQQVDAFNSISELAQPDFAPSFFPHWFLGHIYGASITVVNGCGGIMMIVTAAACLILLAYRALKARKAGEEIGERNIYLFVLGSWFVITFFTCRLGVRMIQHFAFPCAVLVAIFCGLMIGDMRRKWQTQTAKDAAMTIIVSVILGITVTLSAQGAVGTYKNMRGLISDSNAAAMDCIAENAETEDAVVLSWWDLGYFYEYESGHPVLWDGGGQDPDKLITVGRLLSTDDPSLSRALMKMLCTTGTKAVTALTDKLGDSAGYDALWKLAVMDSSEAKEALVSDYGFSEAQAERLDGWLHPSNPREIYLVLTTRMTGQLGWFEYYGNWDFDGENTEPVNYSYAVLPDGSADINSEDEEVQKFFENRSQEILWRLYLNKDGIADESTASGIMFDMMIELDDGYDSVQVWKVN